MVLTLFVTLLFGTVTQTADDEFKFWSKQRELQWEDFHKLPPTKTEKAAMSLVGVEFFANCIDGKFRFEVNAFFNRDSSWVRQVKGIDKLLRHEQGHFDIAEIAARELRQALSELSDPCDDLEAMKKQINAHSLYNKRRLATLQNDYDLETSNGAHGKKQNQWEEKIANRLKELEKYK
jgi:hypothetical protein